MKRTILLGVGLFTFLCSTLQAQVPQIINYQGRVLSGSNNFDGTGQFKFALVNANGSTTYWSNDGTSTAGSQPTNAVSLTVTKGLYSVLLGDTTIANMTVAIPASVFANSDVRLRVWFNDGTHGSQLLAPDQRIASVGYANMAGNVVDGAITSTKIVNGAVGSSQIASGAVGSTQLAGSSVGATQIANSSITAAKIANAQVVKSVNGLTDALTLSAGANMSITPSGNTLTLASTGGGPWSLNGTSAYYNGGKVGIGTSTPNEQLEIASSTGGRFIGSDGGGTSRRAILLQAPTASQAYGRLVSYNYGASAGLTLALNDTGGNVGIGTTAPDHQLTIRKFPGSPAWTSNGWLGALSLDNASAIGWEPDSSGTAFGMGHTNGSFLLFHTLSGPGNLVNPANYDFTVTDAGNIGIGTTVPALKLTVQTPTNTYGIEHTDGSIRVGTYVGGTPAAGWLGTLSNDNLFLFTNNHLRMMLDTVGNVGIGTSSPVGKLHLFDGFATSERIECSGGTNAWSRIEFVNGNGQWDVGTSRGYYGDAFYVARDPSPPVFYVQPNGDTYTQGIMSCAALTIRGGADLAEPFQMKEELLDKGSVVVIDEEHPGRLKRSAHAYDRRVAGIVSGANGINPGIALHQEGALEGGQNVALSGRVYVEADTSNGQIEPGDFLTTSDQPGRAMKVTDYNRAQGAVIGKAMSALSEGEGKVLVLVSLQ